MSQKVKCSCGLDLTITKIFGEGSIEPVLVVNQCEVCSMQFFHYGWVDGDASTTEVTVYADALAKTTIREI